MSPRNSTPDDAKSDQYTRYERARVAQGMLHAVLADRVFDPGMLHTVERIIPSPLFSPLKVSGRISVTVRVAGAG